MFRFEKKKKYVRQNITLFLYSKEHSNLVI